MADSEEVENRFAHLLVPIRDLQKNWDVDLSALLENYLNELGNVNINDVILPAPKKPSSQVSNTQERLFMNFAEAALLIQGTTQIYSKKVEYLYALVFKLLELLSKKHSKSRRSQDGNDAEKDAPNKQNEEEEPFLSLDDMQVNNKTDLDESDQILVKEKAPKLIKPMPLALVPLEDFEKSNVPLVTKTGEVIGKKDDYRVNTCFLHTSGTLLLEISNARLINAPDDDDGMVHMTAPALSQHITQPYHHHLLSMSVANDVGNAPGHISPENVAAYPHGSSPQLPIEGSAPMLDEVAVENDGFEPFPSPGGSSVEFEGDVSTKIPQATRLRAKENLLPNTEAENEKRKQIVKEAWIELNEYDAASGPAEKQVRKGATFKIPACLVLKRNNRKRKIDEDDTENVSIVELARQDDGLPKDTLADFFKNVFNKRNKFPKNPLKVPLYGELDDLYWDEQKRRRLLRTKRSTPLNELPEAMFTAIRERAVRDELPIEEEINESQIDRNLMSIFDGPDDEDEYAHGDDFAPAEPLHLNDEDFLPPTINVSHDDGGRMSVVSSVNFDTYEEYVKHNVEKYLQKAKQSVAITNLAKRVQDWEEKVHPLLLLEEQRRSFDVHKYGDEILNFFKENDCIEFFFRQFAATKPKWEVCRYFLAALILANQGSVDVSQNGVMEQGLNTMKLKFLSAERHYAQLEDYLAPSVQERS